MHLDIFDMFIKKTIILCYCQVISYYVRINLYVSEYSQTTVCCMLPLFTLLHQVYGFSEQVLHRFPVYPYRLSRSQYQLLPGISHDVFPSGLQ